MNDRVGLDLIKQGLHCGGIGDVAIVIGDGRAGMAIRAGPQIEDCHLCLWMALHNEADNVAAQKAASANDEDLSERLYLFRTRHDDGWRVMAQGTVRRLRFVCGENSVDPFPPQGYGSMDWRSPHVAQGPTVLIRQVFTIFNNIAPCHGLFVGVFGNRGCIAFKTVRQNFAYVDLFNSIWLLLNAFSSIYLHTRANVRSFTSPVHI
jgi:hypothetical protein